MAETEMPPQWTGEPEYADPKDTEGHVAAAAVDMARGRVTQWTTFVTTAISAFESNANNHIEHLDYDKGEVIFEFDPILIAFAKAVKDFCPGFKEVKEAVDQISNVMDGIQSSYDEKLTNGLAGAKLRLHDSVNALVQAARDKVTEVAPIMRDHMPEAVDNAMTWVDSASTADEYVSALCDWMGFPEPTKVNTIFPVRQALENPFFGVYQAVRCQLLRTQGVAGLSDDDLNPTVWEHDAVETQRELYQEAGDNEKEAVWEKAYEGILPDRFSRS